MRDWSWTISKSCRSQPPALSPSLRSRVYSARIAGPKAQQLRLHRPSEWSCGLLVHLLRRREIQLLKDLVNGARIAVVQTGCALVKKPDVVIALRQSARLRCFRASGIGLLNDCGDIDRTGRHPRPCLRELLVRQDDRGWTCEDGDSNETMTDLSYWRTSDLCG